MNYFLSVMVAIVWMVLQVSVWRVLVKYLAASLSKMGKNGKFFQSEDVVVAVCIVTLWVSCSLLVVAGNKVRIW